jgi:hypothetical protein
MEIVSGGEALREALSFLAWRGRVLGKYWEILGNADVAESGSPRSPFKARLLLQYASMPA